MLIWQQVYGLCKTCFLIRVFSAQVMEPADKLHLYGLNPLLDPAHNTYIATGCSGQGMTGAAIAAMTITDAIFDRPNPWRDVRILCSECNPLSLD